MNFTFKMSAPRLGNDIDERTSLPTTPEHRKSAPQLKSSTFRRGSFFGTTPKTTPEQRRLIARQSPSLRLHNSGNRNKRGPTIVAGAKSRFRDASHDRRRDPSVLKISFVDPDSYRGRSEIGAATLDPNLEQTIEALVAEKDKHFVERRRLLLDGPPTPRPDEPRNLPSADSTKRATASKSSRCLPLVLPRDEDAERLGLQVLSPQVLKPSVDLKALGVSPLLTMMVQDKSYPVSPAAEHLEKSKLSPIEAKQKDYVDNEVRKIAHRMLRWDEKQGNSKVAESTNQSLQRLVNKLKKQVDFWKEKFRKEAMNRSRVFELHDQLKVERFASSTERAEFKAKASKNIQMLSRKVSGLEYERATARSEAEHWKLRYTSEALWQANSMSSAGCTLVNCRYRQQVVEYEKTLKRLRAERDALSEKVGDLIKESQEKILVSCYKPEDEPPAMASKLTYPLSMASLPPIETIAKKKGGSQNKNKGPPKPWKLKRVLRELAALFSTKVDSDRRCDYARTQRLSMPQHCRAYYLTLEGTMQSASNALSRLIFSVNYHANVLDSSEASPLTQIFAATIGLTNSATFTARTGHVLIGLMCRIVVSIYGEEAVGAAAAAAVAAAEASAQASGEAAISGTTTKETINGSNIAQSEDTKISKASDSTRAIDITIGGILRVILLKAAMKGEMSVKVSLVETLRCIRYSFPLLVSETAPDRLALDPKIRHDLVLDLCTLFGISNTWPFTQACRGDIQHAQRKLDRAKWKKMKALARAAEEAKKVAQGAVKESAISLQGTLANPKFDVLEEGKLDNDNMSKDGGKCKSEDRVRIKPQKTVSSPESSSLQNRLQSVSKKMRKLLLSVADNSKALRNLFAVFDEDGSGAVSPEELRISLSQFGILLNRKDTRKLVELVDENGDGELQYTELLALVDAVQLDEYKHNEAKRIEDAIAAEINERKRRKERKHRERQIKRAQAEAASTSASEVFKFSNVMYASENDSDSTEDSEMIDDERKLDALRRLSLEEVAEEYINKLKEEGESEADIPSAPLFLVLKRCMNAFLRQEAANAERLLKYYRVHDLNKDGNLSWDEFKYLVESMNERSGMKYKMGPEESSECYIEASQITTENVRVDDQKFLLAMMCKGIVAPELENE